MRLLQETAASAFKGFLVSSALIGLVSAKGNFMPSLSGSCDGNLWISFYGICIVTRSVAQQRYDHNQLWIEDESENIPKLAFLHL